MRARDFDLNLLQAFDALFAERSVTRAARRLAIGQPAMSDTLRRLRVVFGDELFVRAASAMQPTPKAKALAEEIGPLLERMQRVVDGHVTFVPGAANDTFTLASTDYTTLVLLPPLLAEMRIQAPAVDFRVTGYEKEAIGGMLDRGEADLAFGVFPDPPDNLVRTRLFTERFVGIARTDHPRLGDSAIDLETFVAQPHALVSVRRDERGAIDQVLARLGLRRRIALVVPYMLLLPKVLAVSDMIAIVPERAAGTLVSPDIRTFELPFETTAWPVDMLWNPSARADQAASWLRRNVSEIAKSL